MAVAVMPGKVIMRLVMHSIGKDRRACRPTASSTRMRMEKPSSEASKQISLRTSTSWLRSPPSRGGREIAWREFRASGDFEHSDSCCRSTAVERTTRCESRGVVTPGLAPVTWGRQDCLQAGSPLGDVNHVDQQAQLLQRDHTVVQTFFLDDLAVLNAKNGRPGEVHLPATRCGERTSQKVTERRTRMG